MMKSSLKPIHCFVLLLGLFPLLPRSLIYVSDPAFLIKQYNVYCESVITGPEAERRQSHERLFGLSIRFFTESSTTLLLAHSEKNLADFEKSDIEIVQNSIEEKLLANEKAARQRRIGQMKERHRKSVNREDRITELEIKWKDTASMPESESYEHMPQAERKELKGLLKVRESFEEQYNPLAFTEEHVKFKAMHNQAFTQLSLYCQRERNRLNIENGVETTDKVNVFFLDGPDGGTASALIENGNFDPHQCFVANRHQSTCDSLRRSGGGLIPDENVVCATAAEALTDAPTLAAKDDILKSGKDGTFADVDFSSYYFDGCGGFVPHILGMISAALIRENYDATGPIAVGYSILGGNKDVVGKELNISQALNIMARKRDMRMLHVLDDPLRYGISADIQKIGGAGGAGTFTTWLLLEPCD